ncbi:hypothetical protein OSTOST_23858, partial [Ostertagia ostertagi]
GTNVVIPNGALDPWSLVSKLTSKDPTVVPYLVPNSAHCDDMFPLEPRNPPEMKVLHQLIAQNIDNWISNVPSPYYRKVEEPWKPWVGPEMKHPLEGMENAFIPAGQHLSRASLAKMSPEQSRILRRVHLGRPPHGMLPEPDM